MASNQLTNAVEETSHFTNKSATKLQDTLCALEYTHWIALTPMQTSIAENRVKLGLLQPSVGVWHLKALDVGK